MPVCRAVNVTRRKASASLNVRAGQHQVIMCVSVQPFGLSRDRIRSAVRAAIDVESRRATGAMGGPSSNGQRCVVRIVCGIPFVVAS